MPRPSKMPKAKVKKRTTAKASLKDTLAKTLEENPQLLREAVADVLEDIALAKAIDEGRKTKFVSREEIFKILGSRK